MSDQEAIQYLSELKEFNKQGKMTTPNNRDLGFDTFYDCAFEHALRALQERIENQRKEKHG